MVEDSEEGFAVGAGVEGFSAEGGAQRDAFQGALVLVGLIYCGRHIPEGFGAEEEAFAGADGTEAEFGGAGEGIGIVRGRVGGKGEVAIAAFERETIVKGDGFEQSGFAGAVFSSEEGQA